MYSTSQRKVDILDSCVSKTRSSKLEDRVLRIEFRDTEFDNRESRKMNFGASKQGLFIVVMQYVIIVQCMKEISSLGSTHKKAGNSTYMDT